MTKEVDSCGVDVATLSPIYPVSPRASSPPRGAWRERGSKGCGAERRCTFVVINEAGRMSRLFLAARLILISPTKRFFPAPCAGHRFCLTVVCDRLITKINFLSVSSLPRLAARLSSAIRMIMRLMTTLARGRARPANINSTELVATR